MTVIKLMELDRVVVEVGIHNSAWHNGGWSFGDLQ